MDRQQSRLIKDGFLLGAIIFAILLVTLYIPFLGYFSILLLPVPVAVFCYRYGWKSAAIFSVIILLLISLFAFYFFIISLPITLVAIIAGLFIGEALKSKRHPYEVWSRGTIGYAIGFLILLLIIHFLSDQSLVTEYQLMIKESLDSTQLLLSEAGIELSTDDIRSIEKDMMLLLDLIPSILIMVSMLYGFVSQWLTHKVLNRFDQAQLAFPKFRSFKIPKVILTIYFFIVILSWFNFEGLSLLGLIFFNAGLILGFLFTLQGVSFIIDLLAKRRQPKIVSVLVIIIIVVFLPLGMYLTRILGIIDVGFNLRNKL
ncbi:YybS family protein [Amphibacillus xylanus]|uniref:DUF2232 domain-containing protein n=1 Tax=Amphibacillus xylanus (strain ATCC 51415 / DSM 6626 / JCM 7361 / LMG 17667 / NBRC 15112 / Ep01) TaxID=698758 RepID=K0J0X6_AMPXN|nr:DUF2232 domain-containing protein [Amphibacillus xylanus]BAM48520.1 hypothetical protein AXY_23880 [Amphibacillus xylanus NBRC 15112]